MPNTNDEAMLVAPPPPLFDPTKPSTPISFPIKTLQDLKSRSYFDSFHFSFNRSSVRLRRKDTWKENYPKASADIAGYRKYDVYMGIDVFGRGTYGGGQWTANVALDLLKKNNVSAAMFAPGWVYETEQPPDFHTAQNKWWSLVEKSWGIVQRYPQALPFYSDFNQGLGSHVSLGGRKLSDAPWYNISCQSLQPLLEFNEGKNSEIMQVTVDGREASYNGGGNVSFRGKLKRNEHFTARHFKPKLQLSASPISISYSVKSDERSELGILLRFSSASQETKSLLMAPNESIHRFGDMFLPCHLTSTQSTSDWTVHETNLVLDGHTLTEISAVFYKPEDLTEETNTQEYFALLGHISIKCQQNTKLYPPASSWVIEAHHVKVVPGDSGSRTLSCKLEWRLKYPEEDFAFTRYNVYAENLNSSDYRARKVMEEPRSEKVFIGTAHVDAYYVSDMVVGADVKGVRFVVQTCGEDGIWQELDASPNLLVEVERFGSKLC